MKSTYKANNGKTYLRGNFNANCLAPLFPAETQEAFARIDAMQKAQPSAMRMMSEQDKSEMRAQASGLLAMMGA